MRVLVVGTVPPPGGRAAERLAAAAARRIDAGDEVEILSPSSLSAAHRTARLEGVLLGAQLLAASRRFDGIVLRIERGLPLGESAGRVERTLSLLVLGAALRRYQEVVLRLDSPVPLPGGLGGRATTGIWSSATSVVISDESDRRMVLQVPGVDPAIVELDAPSEIDRAGSERWPAATDANLRESVLTVVRQRAARDRDVVRARAALGATAVAVPLSPLLASSGTASPSFKGASRMILRRAYGKVRRLLARCEANDLD